ESADALHDQLLHVKSICPIRHQKLNSAPNLNRRAPRMAVGFSQELPYVVFILSTVLAFRRFARSKFPLIRVAPTLNVLAIRRSTWFSRSSNFENGAMSGTFAVAVHAPVAAGHAARLRPSEGAISAFVAT